MDVWFDGQKLLRREEMQRYALGLQNSSDFLQTLTLILCMFENTGTNDNIKKLIRKWQGVP
jgi:hypothetical protein